MRRHSCRSVSVAASTRNWNRISRRVDSIAALLAGGLWPPSPFREAQLRMDFVHPLLEEPRPTYMPITASTGLRIPYVCLDIFLPQARKDSRHAPAYSQPRAQPGPGRGTR